MLIHWRVVCSGRPRTKSVHDALRGYLTLCEAHARQDHEGSVKFHIPCGHCMIKTNAIKRSGGRRRRTSAASETGPCTSCCTQREARTMRAREEEPRRPPFSYITNKPVIDSVSALLVRARVGGRRKDVDEAHYVKDRGVNGDPDQAGVGTQPPPRAAASQCTWRCMVLNPSTAVSPTVPVASIELFSPRSALFASHSSLLRSWTEQADGRDLWVI